MPSLILKLLLCFQVEWNLGIYFFHVCGRLHITTATDTVLVRWMFIFYAASSLFKYLSCMWTCLHFILKKKVCWKNNDWLYVCVYISQRKSCLLSLKVSPPILTALHSGWKLYSNAVCDWFDGFRKLVVQIPRNISELKLQSKLNASKNFILISSWYCTFILNVNSFLFLFFRQERTGKRQVPMMYYYFIYTRISVSLNRSGYYDQLPRNSCSHFQDCDFSKQFLTKRM